MGWSDSSGMWETYVPSWELASGGAGVYHPVTPFSSGPTNGINVLYLYGGSVHQTTPATVQANTTYTLKVDIGQRSDLPASPYDLQLIAGSTVLAEDNNGLHPQSGGWLTSTLSWSSGAAPATLGQPLEILISAPGGQMDFDNVRLTAQGPATTPNNYRFTDMEQDAESGLNHTWFRQQSPVLGRWMSPDPAGLSAVDFWNPQSLNQYAYVLNKPITRRDPVGLYCAYLNDAGDGVESITDDGDKDGCRGSGGYWIEGGYGGGAQIIIDVNSGTVTGTGYDSNGNLEFSIAGAMNSNAWGAWTQTFSSASLISGSSQTIQLPGNAVNNGQPTPSKNPKICGGTFTFAGMEADVGEGGAFTGVIHEHDSIDGNSVGNLTEVWGGGEAAAAGVGKITSRSDKNIFQGFLGFVGAGASAGPLAGIQFGYAGGTEWGGLYVEGHIGHFAWGGGGYLRTSCKVGG